MFSILHRSYLIVVYIDRRVNKLKHRPSSGLDRLVEKPRTKKKLTVNVQPGRMRSGPGSVDGRARIFASVFHRNLRYVQMTDNVTVQRDVLTD